MKHIALLLALSLATVACASTDNAGVRDPDLFRQVALRTTIESARPYSEVAQCFEARAALLPMTAFAANADDRRTTYRLRGLGFTFEEIDFEAMPDGSRATVMIAPNLNDRWQADFEKDRLAPLRACASGANQ